MASVVRLYLSLIVCVQLTLGNLPALIHQARCDCSAANSSPETPTPKNADDQDAEDKGADAESRRELCDLHCHCKHDEIRESSHIAATAHCDESAHHCPAEGGSHDEDRCALCQLEFVYGAPTSLASAPAVERFFGVPLPTYCCEFVSSGDFIAPSPRGPPLI